ncbi:hypothetical protein SAMN05421821_10688 [Mucilaginibacter lappiensis]|uniref:Molybdopterin-guanine dinucleotide biosynthesis protein MobB n=1 Tax=Mucilaginibacter lappiensis TaxID=354630 RepID=A0ABR6PPR7_9SPHI|nr:DUF5712 family protein [Mucilaginibacter lappiensis]MBB6110281.1 hypothetical protein [Mucilaginibacter lappiensis]SIR29003.1 hypothetical protein SAMN05421821_10688 [Mucilaginibacter lappiensis]
MFVNITKSETGNNKGSSSQLVVYLEKENRLAEQLKQSYRPEYWFNPERDNIQAYEVRQGIDNNIAKLSRDEAKFFLINISPSEKELLYLKSQLGEEGAKEQLKRYANDVMHAYAKNFKRNGIDGNQDLVYYGKLEHHRYYTYKDLEVRKGQVKRGDRKPGEQMHVQIIVSRKDASNRIKLSPLNNSRGTNAVHSQQVGQFDRVAFKQATERLFDSRFGYEREIKESFKYANTLKHGSYEQKQEVKEQQKQEQAVKIEKQQSHHQGKGLLAILLDGQSVYAAPAQDDDKKRKRKKKRGRNLDQSQGQSI